MAQIAFLLNTPILFAFICLIFFLHFNDVIFPDFHFKQEHHVLCVSRWMCLSLKSNSLCPVLFKKNLKDWRGPKIQKSCLTPFKGSVQLEVTWQRKESLHVVRKVLACFSAPYLDGGHAFRCWVWEWVCLVRIRDAIFVSIWVIRPEKPGAEGGNADVWATVGVGRGCSKAGVLSGEVWGPRIPTLAFYQSHVKTALIPAEKPNPNNEVQ